MFDGALHLIRKDQLLLNGCSPPERVCCCHPRGEGMGMGSTRALLPVPGPSLFVGGSLLSEKSHVIPLTVFRCVTSDRWNHWLFRGPKKSEGIQITCDIVGEPCVGESRVGCAEGTQRGVAGTVTPSSQGRHSFEPGPSLLRPGATLSSRDRHSFEPGPRSFDQEPLFRADAVTCLWGRSGSGSRRRSSCSSRRAPRGGLRPGSRL